MIQSLLSFNKESIVVSAINVSAIKRYLRKNLKVLIFCVTLYVKKAPTPKVDAPE